MVNAVEAFDAKHMKPAEEIPAFRPGDTVDVNVKIKEGNNSRIQTFTGVVIARQGSGLRETFLVRKISCTPRPSTPSSWCARAACVARSCTTCASCAARRLASSSVATTPPRRLRPEFCQARRQYREIQPGADWFRAEFIGTPLV